jgi:hypothetical protein
VQRRRAVVLARFYVRLGLLQGAIAHGRLEQQGSVDPAAHRLDPCAPQHIQPVEVLTRVPGESNPDIQVLMVGKGEGAGCLLAGAIAAIVARARFIPVGRDRDPPRGWPGSEGADAAGRESSGNGEIARVDLSAVRQREGSGGLDAFRHQQVVRRRRMAPQHGTPGGALTLLQARRLLRIARPSIGAAAEFSLTCASTRDVDAVRMMPAVGRHGLEHHARVAADQAGLLLLRPGRVVVRQLAPADHRSRRHRHGFGWHAEPVG